jgi:hypothetical protein
MLTKQITNLYSHFKSNKRCPFCGKFSLIRIYSGNGHHILGDIKLQDLDNDAYAECPRCSKFFRLFEEKSLPSTLSATHTHTINHLEQIIAQVFSGSISIENAKTQISQREDISSFIRDFAGKEIPVPNALLSFGDGSQLGDLRIHNLAGGHIITITVNIYKNDTK